MTTITKTIIASKICDHFGFSKNFADHLTSAIFDAISQTIIEDKKINIPNLGSFQIHEKKSRPGMNINKGEKIVIEARKVIRFVPSKTIKTQVNARNKILHNK